VQNRLYELDEKGACPRPFVRSGVRSRRRGPHRDRRVKFSLAAVFLSLGAGLASAYLRVVLSPQVYEASDVRRSVQGAFLGRLPLRRKQEAMALENCPIQAEAIRMVRTALLVRLSGPDGAIVQITSAGTGSGKSTMAILLARSLAQCGKNVLLVDADLHQPSLASRFVLDPAPGLINLLADKNVESQSIRATSTPKLRRVAGGQVEPARRPGIARGRCLSGLAGTLGGRGAIPTSLCWTARPAGDGRRRDHVSSRRRDRHGARAPNDTAHPRGTYRSVCGAQRRGGPFARDRIRRLGAHTPIRVWVWVWVRLWLWRAGLTPGGEIAYSGVRTCRFYGNEIEK